MEKKRQITIEDFVIPRMKGSDPFRFASNVMNVRYLFTGVLLTGVLVGAVMIARSKGLREPSDLALATPDTRVRGPAKAPVKIIEYSDFQCPACQKAQAAIQYLFELYPGKIQLTFRHFPLAVHQWAGPAHQAAECAHEQGNFWEYHDRLYGEQPVWSSSNDPTEIFLRYARDLGLDLDRFGLCLVDERIKRRILEEREKGRSLQVSSTPTFFFNGERVVGPVEFGVKGKQVVRQALGLPVAEEPKKFNP